MKLLRYGRKGAEKPGLMDAEGKIRDLSGVLDDIDGAALAPRRLARIARVNPRRLPVVSPRTRLGPPVANVGKVVAIGLNYVDHARETGSPIPSEPIVFMKATSSIVGPNDDVVIPKRSKKTDWEVELGIVIGTEARYVPKSRALDHVAGYCVVNDVSERAFQLEGTGTWDKGKGCDTFCPFGPWLVTKDEVPRPERLGIWLEVDGERHQDSSTKNLIFGVAHLVSYVSHHMSLQPGDLIATGTPPGVGLGLKPPRFLRPGNVMRLGIDGLGEQRQRVVAYKA